MGELIHLTEEQLALHKNMGTVVRSGSKTFYYLPMWIEHDPVKHSKDIYEVYGLDNLPPDLKNTVKKAREDKKKTSKVKTPLMKPRPFDHNF